MIELWLHTIEIWWHTKDVVAHDRGYGGTRFMLLLTIEMWWHAIGIGWHITGNIGGKGGGGVKVITCFCAHGCLVAHDRHMVFP
jgi:hypothetical protein